MKVTIDTDLTFKLELSDSDKSCNVFYGNVREDIHIDRETKGPDNFGQITLIFEAK